MSEVLLSVQGLEVAYGGIRAVKGVSLEVRQGEKVCLIGSNGAGKTTTLKAITGTLPACKVEGTVSYQGASLKGSQSFHLVEKKLAMVPEGRGVFPNLSVKENLVMAARPSLDGAGRALATTVRALAEGFSRRNASTAGALSLPALSNKNKGRGARPRQK